ncbi:MULTISPECIES: hypothetical protein [unclassified Acidovorax]|uniref:hypothetical protein n=1 Tax=unclassified Acidovorax TaxID=2684926 RepID=UPI000ACC83A7|nr:MULTISPECIES: hypothetical protein [unclassified Acidovorax]
MKRKKENILNIIKSIFKINQKHHEKMPDQVTSDAGINFRKSHFQGKAMSDCNCNQNNANDNSAQVPNFAEAGFAEGNSHAQALQANAGVAAQLEGVHALKLSVCVGASYNASTNKICFTIPIYGNYCVTSPVHIPVGGQIKVCAQTCGSFIPTGLKATIYLNGSVIANVTLFGAC